MGDIYRDINEEGEPETTAEKELKKLLGEAGLQLFNKYFPPDQVLTEHQKAKEFDAWLTENKLKAEAELLISETSAKSKEQLLYLEQAVNYLTYCSKSRRIPDQAKFPDVFAYIGGEAKKLASQQTAIANPNILSVLATLKSLIDLKREEFSEDSDLPAIIKELSDKMDYLKKATAEQDDK